MFSHEVIPLVLLRLTTAKTNKKPQQPACHLSKHGATEGGGAARLCPFSRADPWVLPGVPGSLLPSPALLRPSSQPGPGAGVAARSAPQDPAPRGQAQGHTPPSRCKPNSSPHALACKACTGEGCAPQCSLSGTPRALLHHFNSTDLSRRNCIHPPAAIPGPPLRCCEVFMRNQKDIFS